MKYVKFLKLELLKIRKSYVLFSILAFGVLLEGIYAINLNSSFHVSEELNGFIDNNIVNKWYGVFNFHLELVTITSFIMSFVPIILMQIEYKNNMRKQLNVMPFSQFTFFLSKFSILVLLLISTILILCITKGVGVYMSDLQKIFKNDNFLSTISLQLYIALRLFFSQLGILALLLLINFKITNLVLNVIISVTFWIMSFLSVFYFLPFGYSQASQFQMTMTYMGHGTLFNFVVFKYEIYSCIFCCLILTLAKNIGEHKKLMVI